MAKEKSLLPDNQPPPSNSPNSNTRLPPNSQESEMIILGSMLTNINSLNTGSELLREEEFYYSEHREIFSVLSGAYRQDKPADAHIVAEELRRQGKLEKIGGAVYLTTLAQYAGTSAYLEEYIEIVKEKAILRKMIEAAQRVEQSSLSQPENVLDALDGAQQLFFQISQMANPSAGKLLSELLSGARSTSKIPYLTELEQRQEKFKTLGGEEHGVTGIPTHLIDLDKVINGLGRSNLLILAARPAMGKTALALNIAENVCFRSNMPVGIFSLEMSAEQLMHRLIATQSQVESEKITKGSLSGMEYQKVVAAVHQMQKHTMVIDDQPGLKITDLRARARRMKERYQIQLLVIDYLQLLTGSGTVKSAENRQSEISEISRMLKTLARELDIPVICLSQLSRKVEERTGHRPMMSDLRESGSIEQDADVVMFLLRREYYDPLDKPGQGEIIVAKNRHGPVGNVLLTWKKDYGQFTNYSPVIVDGKAAIGMAEDSFSPFSP